MDVPFVDLHANHKRIAEEVDSAIEDVIDDAWFIGGHEVERFEERFAEYVDAEYAIAVASGTDAIRLSLEAIGVDSGDEVATVSHTFVSTVDGIVHNDARPRFVDIDLMRYTMDVADLRDAMTDDVSAIMPVHLYGQPYDVEAITEIAEEFGVPVVEDACQAHGARYRGDSVGSFGTLACFSFYPSKNLGAYGDGGMVVTDDAQLANRLRNLREYGTTEKYHHREVGYNSRLDSIQAAILRAKIPHLDAWNDERRTAADRYNELLADTPLVLPSKRDEYRHVYHLYVVQARSAAEREELRAYLEDHNVGTGIHYPVPVHEQESYRTLDYEYRELPNTERVSRRILSLPMYPELPLEAQRYVGETIQDFYS